MNQHPPLREHSTWSLFRLLALPLLLGLFGLSGCKTVGSFYTHPRIASYYVNRYCFEVPKADVLPIVDWMLTRYHFPVKTRDLKTGNFATLPVHMSRFGRNPKWGYTVGLRIRVREEKGKLSLKHIPNWVLQKKAPKAPKAPDRSDFQDGASFQKATEKYQANLQQLIQAQNKGVELMRRWQGCNVRKSTLRTTVEIDTKILAYPATTFGTIQRNRKGKPVKSYNRIEYSMLRVIGWKLKRLKYMRPLIQR